MFVGNPQREGKSLFRKGIGRKYEFGGEGEKLLRGSRSRKLEL